MKTYVNSGANNTCIMYLMYLKYDIKIWQMLGQRCVSSQDKGNVVGSGKKLIHDPKICLYASYIHMVCTLSNVF